jgi:VCBS repeat-containing protein
LSGTAPNLTYTPTTNYNGADSFTFKANDGTVDSTPATVSITVTAINDTPTATPQSVSTNEDTAKAITLSGSDVDGDTLTFNVVTGPTHGALSGTAPNLTYTPTTNYNGSDSFTFKANDGTVDSTPATVSITVTAVNDAPTATPQSVTTSEDTAKAITLSGSDPESDTLTFSVVTGPTHGVLSGTAPNLTYTPAADYNGPDSFTFKANDGTTDSPSATVSITVTAVNDAPTADPQSVTTNEDTAKAVTLTATDIDGNSLAFSVVTNPAHGALSGTAPNLTYTPSANYNGPDSFTFKANDGTVDSNTATISITVNPVNDAPTISDMSDMSINEDTATGAISFTVADIETAANSLTVSGSSNNAALVPNANIVFGGSGANRTVTITPAPNANGTALITVSVNDGTNTTSDTFLLTVVAVNDAPTADDQSVATNASTAKDITLTGSDIETPTNSLTFTITASPAHGTLTGTPPNVTYHPGAFDGSDSFKFTVTDTGDGVSAPLTSSEATVSITISIAPEIAVEQPTGTSLSDGGSTVDFGDVSVDEDNSHTFTIRNLGSADLTGLGITIDGADAADFTITSTPTAPVAPGGSTTFTVKFAPSALDTRAAALHIVSNDADENPFDIALTGTGITNLEAWRLLYFGNIDDGGPGADTNDPDFDGLSNVLEFATGNDPAQSSPMPGILNLSGDTIEFVYTRTTAAINDGFTFQVEWSDDLTSANWTSAGVTEEILSDDGTLQEVKASVAAENGARRLLHLKVTQP